MNCSTGAIRQAGQLQEQDTHLELSGATRASMAPRLSSLSLETLLRFQRDLGLDLSIQRPGWCKVEVFIDGQAFVLERHLGNDYGFAVDHLAEKDEKIGQFQWQKKAEQMQACS
jgi:hypothetical protein